MIDCPEAEQMRERHRRPWAYGIGDYAEPPDRQLSPETTAIGLRHWSVLPKLLQDLIRLQWSGDVEAHYWYFDKGVSICVVPEVAILPA